MIENIRGLKIKFALFFFSLITPLLSYADPSSGDLLSASRQQVTSNFGSNSTFMYYLLIAEVIVALVTYISSRNVKHLMNIVIVMIFINIVFVMINGF
jgi:type IV conjugative transfer system pilin TraA